MLPHVGLALGVAAVSSAAVLIRLAAEAPPLVIGAYRLCIASVLVLAATGLAAPSDLRSYSRALLLPALVSGAFLALHFASWITSLQHTSVASSLVLVTTTPLMIALVPPKWTGDAVSRQTVLGIVVALVGTSMIAFGDARAEPGSLAGNALALLGAAAMAGHRLAGRRLRRELSLLAYVSVTYPVAALLLLGAALVSAHPMTGFSGATYGYLLLLALLPQALGHSALNWALGHLSAVAVSSAVMAEPVVGTALALLILGEVPQANQLLGGAVVLSGVYFALQGEGQGRSPQPAER